jgi:hypothetical protein
MSFDQLVEGFSKNSDDDCWRSQNQGRVLRVLDYVGHHENRSE